MACQKTYGPALTVCFQGSQSHGYNSPIVVKLQPSSIHEPTPRISPLSMPAVILEKCTVHTIWTLYKNPLDPGFIYEKVHPWSNICLSYWSQRILHKESMSLDWMPEDHMGLEPKMYLLWQEQILSFLFLFFLSFPFSFSFFLFNELPLLVLLEWNMKCNQG